MEAFEWAYEFMTGVTLSINGYEVSMWQLFMFMVTASLLVWILRKIFLD